MIGVLLLASTFLILIFVGIIVLLVSFKNYVKKRDEEWERKTDEIKHEVEQLRQLFQDEVTNVLDNFRNLLK